MLNKRRSVIYFIWITRSYLERMLETVINSFHVDIGKEIGLEKCAEMTFKKGKITKSDVTLTNDNVITDQRRRADLQVPGSK